MNALLILMLCIIGVQHLFYIHTVNKLVNKLMSRNYYDFQVSEKVTKTHQETPGFKMDDDTVDEDMGHLAGIG